MSCSGTSECLCGCCAGTNVQTPQPETNAPGLAAVARRMGTWAQFKESMLARLSSADYPALQPLQTRQDDDFTIALLDATSVVLDILTFYQERLANECYLRTAQQPRSLTELSRLIGYQPAPGVAAAAYVAFTLTQPAGQPANPNAPAITIPQGTQLQSVPAQGQTPQVFETSADIPAKADWTALPVQTGIRWNPQINDVSVYLAGTATQLNPGDVFLIVGDDRIGQPANMNWDVRMVSSIQTDTANNRTFVKWDEGLGWTGPGGSPTVAPSSDNPKFFAFRQRAGLFGYNAVDPRLLNAHNTRLDQLLAADHNQWLNFNLSTVIDLDSLYPKVTSSSWAALIRPDGQSTRIPAGYVSLYNVLSVAPVTRSDFGLSGKITRIAPDYNTDLGGFPLRNTIALVQSEQLLPAEQPLDYPLYGASVTLEVLRNDLAGVTVIALSGKRQKIALAVPPSSLSQNQFVPDDVSSNSRPLLTGEVFTLTKAANLPVNGAGSCIDWKSAGTPATLYVEDENGRTGIIMVEPNCFALSPSAASDPVISEYALVSQVDSTGISNTIFNLNSPLAYCYDRTTTHVNANVGLATAGQSVTEILGNGSAATLDQEFTLKQSPLTYIQAASATGRASTLTVAVNGMNWMEVPTLYQAGPAASVYATLYRSDGTTDVLFGDGSEGATLPTGQNNVQARYRIGSGMAGNIAAGTLTTLMDRPLGVNGVTNPEAATGGQDPQSLAEIRQNASQTVLTLGRAVSITDYQNYASTFAGIAKAYAIWIPNGPGRGVYLTVAGIGGAALPPGNPTYSNLVSSLQSHGNPLVPLTIQTYVETLFALTASVQYDPAFDQTTTQALVLQTLWNSFNFTARSFGQGVSGDEVATIIQNVPGVVAVNITSLKRGVSSTGGDISQTGSPTVSQWNTWLAGTSPISPPLTPPSPDTPTRLCACLPVPSQTMLPSPAEILVLDPRPSQVALNVMS